MAGRYTGLPLLLLPGLCSGPASPLLPWGHAGSAILRFDSKLGSACDTLNSAFPVPALNACKSWREGSNGGAPDLKLALAVADDCSVTIQPVGDKTCADPGAVAGTAALFPHLAGLSAADEYLYTYNDLTIRAYYIAANKIRTLLPSSDGGARWACIPSHTWFGWVLQPPLLSPQPRKSPRFNQRSLPPVCSSFMLHISPKTATTVDLQFLAATNKPGDAGIAYGASFLGVAALWAAGRYCGAGQW